MEQRTPAWFAARRHKITGSSVGAILGLSPYRKPEDVMRAMVREYHGAPSEFTGNSATEWGTLMEDQAAASYTMETGNKITPEGFLLHPVQQWLGASPDGLIGADGLIEIKCPYGLRNKSAPEFKTLKEQPYYEAQIQIQLFVTDRKWCDFYQWAPAGTELERVEINRAFLQEAIPRLFDFYQRYKREIHEPQKYGIGDDLGGKVAEYRELMDTIEHATQRKKELLAQIVAFTDETPGKLPHDMTLSKVVKKGSISYAKAIKEIAPNADLEPWRGKPSEYWVIK